MYAACHATLTGARHGSPKRWKYDAGIASDSAGVIEIRHGPCALLLTFQASRTVTPRLRCYQWKQWGSAGYRELRKRGVSKDLAAKTAGSPHGPWRLAHSPALSIALPNAYFAALGLPPLVVRS